MSIPIIEVKKLKKYFPVRANILFMQKEYIRAVENVSFKIYPQETVGLVGESGCGKTTIGRMIVHLEQPTRGDIYYTGENTRRFRGKQLKAYRKKIQYIFQDPYSSLNPRKIVYNIISMGLRNFHIIKDNRKRKEKVSEILEQVGLPPDYLFNYPHEFSGGQRQRISIARTIAVKPDLIICDEPVSALDVSIQAQVINLLKELKNELYLSILFISHDLALVKHISDRILVMYRGYIVESAPSASLFENTSHPYTKALISAIPEPGLDAHKGRIILKGDVTAVTGEIKGCCFEDRCYMSRDICKREPPLGRQLIPGHVSYCHFAEKV
ncbi:MAG: ABC transporter ATP-binding protein [Spirochaetales bacterium]|nr:ABC transporter ATP-binding protein [Spirochaetales bacterium]